MDFITKNIYIQGTMNKTSVRIITGEQEKNTFLTTKKNDQSVQK